VAEEPVAEEPVAEERVAEERVIIFLCAQILTPATPPPSNCWQVASAG
jgi:hypothetical protein